MTKILQVNLFDEESIGVVRLAIPDDLPEPLHGVFANGAITGILSYIKMIGGTPSTHKHTMTLIYSENFNPLNIYWGCKDEDCLEKFSIEKEVLYEMMLAHDS